MENLIVGTEECSIHNVWMVLSKSNFLKEKWSVFAGFLRIPIEDVKKHRQDLILDKITEDDILMEILVRWVGEQESNAQLLELIRVLEDECGDNQMGEKLRLLYNLPCKNFDICLTSWTSLSLAFQDKVEQVASNFFPNTSFDTIKLKLEGDILLDLMTGKKPKLFKSTIPPSPAFYLERTLLPRHTISEKIFDEDAPDIFLFVGINEHELINLVKNHETSTSGEQLDSSEIHVRFMVLEMQNHFKKICKKANAPVHLLSYEKKYGKFKWIETCGRISLLQKFVDDCDDSQLTDKLFLESLKNGKPGAVVVSDSPGMGKSFLLANIALRLDVAGDKLVIFVKVNDCIKEIKTNVEDGNTLNVSIRITLQNLICSNELEILEFSSLISAQDIKIELFIDGFDEIGINDAALALEVINSIAKTYKSIRLWVTTRPHHLEELEVELNVLGYNIKGLDEEEQLSFLVSHWKRSNIFRDGKLDVKKLMNYSKKVLQSVKSQLNKDDNDIAGIPLQCFLIGEVFEEEAIDFAFEKNDMIYPKIRINSISELYEKMIDKKVQKYLQKYATAESLGTEELLDAHIELSIKLLFPHYQQQLNPQSVPHKDLLNIGIVQSYNVTGSTEFIHQTFAEYFVACYVVKQLAELKINENDRFVNFFLSDILQRTKPLSYTFLSNEQIISYKFVRRVICYFINVKLSTPEISRLHKNCFANSAIEPGTQLEIYHACANSSFLQIFKLFFNKACVSRQITLCAIRNSTLEFVKFLLSSLGDIHVLGEKLYCNFLRVAVHRSEPPIFNYLAKSKVYYIVISDLHEDAKLLLHACVSNTKYKSEDDIGKRICIIRLLVKTNSDLLEEKDIWGRTPLLCEYTHVDLVKELIKLGADVTSQDRMGDTVLHMSHNLTRRLNPHEYYSLITSIPKSKLGNVLNMPANDKETPFVRLLNYIDPTEETLHTLFNGQIDSVQDALKVSIANGRNSTILKNLIKLGANISWKGEEGESYLHLASFFGNLDALKLLIEDYNLDVNIKNYRLETPMDYAIKSKGNHRFRTAKALHKFGGGPSVEKEALLQQAIKDGDAELVLIIRQILTFCKDDFVETEISSDDNQTGYLAEHFKYRVKDFVSTIKIAQNDMDGMPLLHLAAQIGDELAVKELVQNGADLNARDLSGNMPIHSACFSIDVDMTLLIIKFLIDNGADVNARTKNNFTFVHILASRGYGGLISPSQFHEIVEYLTKKCLVNLFDTRGPHGCSPLHLACQTIELKEKTIKLLKARGISFNQLNDFGQNSLMHAIMGGRSKAFLNLIINMGCADWRQRDKQGNNGLHVAAQCEHLDALKLLMNLGLDVNQVNAVGNTPLHCVATSTKKSILETAKVLVEGEVDVAKKNHEGHTALELIRRQFDGEFSTEFEKILQIENVKFKANMSNATRGAPDLFNLEGQHQKFLLHNAVTLDRSTNDCWNIIKSLIATGIDDIYAKDQKGYTFLHKFLTLHTPSPSHFHDISKYLIHLGYKDLFEIPVISKSDITILHLIVQHFEPRPDTLQLFKSHGINLNRLDAHGNTMLVQAIAGKRSPEFLSLLAKEFRVKWRHLNNLKENLLHIAVRHGNEDAFKLFVDMGLDVNSRDSVGCTPIYDAIRLVSVHILKMLQLLVSHGAAVDVKNNQYQTLLHCTAFFVENSSILPVIQFLIENGANAFAVDENKCTFLHILTTSRSVTPSLFHQLVEYLDQRGYNQLFHIPIGDLASTPAQYALARLQLEEKTLCLLYSSKSDLNYKDKRGHFSLSFAVSGKQSQKSLQKLVDLGADIKLRNLHGASLLHISTVTGAPEVVELFAELGLDVNAVDDDGDSPLHNVMWQEESDLVLEKVLILLKYGADVSIKNKNGQTALNILYLKDKWNGDLKNKLTFLLLMSYAVTFWKQSYEQIYGEMSYSTKKG